MSEWIELQVVIPRGRVDAVSAAAFGAGAVGLQEAPPPGFTPTFQQPWDDAPPPQPATCALRIWVEPADAEAASVAISAAAEAPVARLDVQTEDWANSWKALHHAVEISPRLRVSPPWEARPGDLVITPGDAFGTGDHPTTLACLRAIDALADGCETCLDVGCGSGVLALAAAKLGLKARGVDIAPEAIRSAREAAEENGLIAEFSTEPLERLPAPWDLVVANLYAEVLQSMAPALIRLTGRHLVLAGILAERAHLVIDALSPAMELTEQIPDGEWVSLRWVPRTQR